MSASLSVKTRLLLSLAAVSVLAACATATPYQSEDHGYGYSEQRIEKNRYRVSFGGNSETPKPTVENYLLYRAAELTVQNGYDYFVMATEGTDANTRYLQSFDGFGGFGRYYWGPAAGFGTSTAVPITQYQAQANVLMFSGAKPENEVKAFDAKQVITNLQPLIVRPPPPKAQ